MKPYYEENGITIYHSDCLDILPSLPKIDLVITDPPYLVAAQGGGEFGKRAYFHEISNRGFDKGFKSELLDNFSDWFCFCGKQQLPDILTRVQNGDNWMLLTWCKTNPTPLTNNNYLPDTEYILHRYSKGRLFGSYKDKSRFFVSPNGQNYIDHPTVKPLEIIIKLLNLGSQVGELILDPFMGSGTTLRAAKDLGRKAIGIEIEEKYCEIAVQRLRQEILPLT